MKVLDSWAQMTRENDPVYQRQQREKRRREEQRKEQAERKSFLNRWVMLPEKMTGRTLAAVLQSLNKQITAAHMNLKVERFEVDEREIKVIFKGDDK